MPQFYLLGPLPEQACELCVSRIGRALHPRGWIGPAAVRTSKPAFGRAACQGRPCSSRSWSLVARLVLLWFTVRHTIRGQGRAAAHRGRGTPRPFGAAARGLRLTAPPNLESIYADQICGLPRQERPAQPRRARAPPRSRPQGIRQTAAGKAAGMESGRSLCRDRRAGSHPRSATDGRRMRGVRDGLQGQARGTNRRRRRRRMARRSGQALRGDRRSSPDVLGPMPASFMPATASIPRSPNSTATFRSG